MSEKCGDLELQIKRMLEEYENILSDLEIEVNEYFEKEEQMKKEGVSEEEIKLLEKIKKRNKEHIEHRNNLANALARSMLKAKENKCELKNL